MDPLLVIFGAPSGTGKTTLVRRLLEVEPTFAFAVSHTTRPPRPTEVDGESYHFVDDAAFDRILAADGFAEWAHVHQHRYGTSIAEVDRLRRAGRDVLFDVDYQGGRSLMRCFPAAASIFILPPSMAEVRRRLQGRGTEAAAATEVRLRNARIEIAAAGEYRYNVVNDDLDRCVGELRAILVAERLRAHRMAALVRALAAEPL